MRELEREMHVVSACGSRTATPSRAPLQHGGARQRCFARRSRDQDPTFGVTISTASGIRAADCRSSHYGLRSGQQGGDVEVRMTIESLLLYPGTYIVEPWVANGLPGRFRLGPECRFFHRDLRTEFPDGRGLVPRHCIYSDILKARLCDQRQPTADRHTH
jgi:hypothetical protein